MGRAPRTKETPPDFREKCRVTRHSRVFCGLTGSQRTPGFGASQNLLNRLIRFPNRLSWLRIVLKKFLEHSSQSKESKKNKWCIRTDPNDAECPKMRLQTSKAKTSAKETREAYNAHTCRIRGYPPLFSSFFSSSKTRYPLLQIFRKSPSK